MIRMVFVALIPRKRWLRADEYILSESDQMGQMRILQNKIFNQFCQKARYLTAPYV